MEGAAGAGNARPEEKLSGGPATFWPQRVPTRSVVLAKELHLCRPMRICFKWNGFCRSRPAC